MNWSKDFCACSSALLVEDRIIYIMARDFEDNMLNPLVFQLHNSAPEVVREVLLERGWREFDGQDKTKWNLQWRGSAFRASEHDGIKPWQRLNHHPKTVRMMRKDSLARHLKRMQVIYGVSQYEFTPVAFIMPNDYTKFVAEYTKERQSHDRTASYWICKPADMSRGRGIFIFHDIKDLSYDSTVIVQKYITNPLLISGYKFDLRIYVCVTSFSPLTVYVYQEGLVRFATEKFDLNSLDNVYAHLTNTSINKFGASYGKDKERVGCGCKWTLSQFRSYLRNLKADDTLLWQKIHNIVTLTLLAIAPSVPQAPNCFELFGFDILIDESFKPWLLEVNFSPALSLDCSSDITVKKSLIHDLIELLNYKAADSFMNIDSGNKTKSGIHFVSRYAQGTSNGCESKQPFSCGAEGKSQRFWQCNDFDKTNNSVMSPCSGSCSAKGSHQNYFSTSHDGQSKEANLQKFSHPKPRRNEASNSPVYIGGEKGTLETLNILPGEQNFDHAFHEEHSLLQLSEGPLNSEVMVNGNISGTHPRKTLTSRLREKMNMPQHSAPSKVAPQTRQMLPSPRTRLSTNGSFHSAHWLQSTDTANHKLTFPTYFISDVDKSPLPRVGDFVLVFPFNEATYEASRKKTDIKIIMQEMHRLINRLLSPQQVKRRNDE